MTTIERRDWRSSVYDVALDRRLRKAGCPTPLSVILATAGDADGPLTEWVRVSLHAGIMLRTSQAEHLVRGASLEETARITGIRSSQVLYYLTRFEDEEVDITSFYNDGWFE